MRSKNLLSPCNFDYFRYIRLTLLSLFLFNTLPVMATTQVAIHYSELYSRMKLMNEGNYNQLDLAFSLPNTPECKLNSALLSTEKSQTEVLYDDDQRLFLPFDETLKNHSAILKLTFAGSKQQCGINMQLRARFPKTEYQRDELKRLIAQLDEALAAFQGFPMRYFLDPIAGLTFSFKQSENKVNIDGKVQSIQQKFELTNAVINNSTTIKFNVKPNIVSPLIK